MAADTDTDLARLLETLIAGNLPQKDYLVAKQDERLPELIEPLFTEAGLTMPLWRTGGRGATSKVIRFRDEGRWLLTESRTAGPEEAIRRLRRFLNANSASYSEVLLCWGLHPTRLFEIADGIRLGPLDALPLSEPQSYFLGDSLSEEERRSTEYTHHSPKPRAVLVKQTREEPIYFHPEGPRPEWTYEDKYFLTDLMHLLPVAIKAPVIRMSEWHRWDAGTPVVSLGGGWGSMRHARAAHDLEKESVDENMIAKIAEEYLALDSVSRNRLRLPLRRLNALLQSEYIGDRAIEAGVAVESLLGHPDDPNPGVTKRLKKRAADLLGTDDDSRRDASKRVKDVYTLRSIAAHGSDLDEVTRERPPYGVKGAFSKPDRIFQVLNDAPDLIIEIVKAILGSGSYPRWRP